MSAPNRQDRRHPPQIQVINGPAQSTQSEQSVLGAMMLDSEIIDNVRQVLARTDFYRENHRVLFARLLEMRDARIEIDFVTTCEELRKYGELDECGSAAYLSALLTTCPTSKNWRHYARAVGESSRARLLNTALTQAQTILQGGDDSALPGVIEALRQQIEQQAQLAKREHDGDELPCISLADMMAQDYPEPKWVVPGILPEGLTLFSGSPKTGKSWLVLNLALAVAAGGVALGTTPVEQGDVLYLALEDNARRLTNRAAKVLLQAAPPERMSVSTEWPDQDRGGLDYLETWLKAHPDARLIVIDTLQKFRPARRANANAYVEDYDATVGLKRLCDAYGVAIVLVHHTTKSQQDDVFDEASGSKGLQGGVDASWVLKRKRMKNSATLFTTGRDQDESEFALTFDENLCLWSAEIDNADGVVSRERQEIIEIMHEADEPLEPRQIAEQLGKPAAVVSRLLWKMKKDGDVSNRNGKYEPCGGNYLPPPPQSPHLHASTPLHKNFVAPPVESIDRGDSPPARAASPKNSAAFEPYQAQTNHDGDRIRPLNGFEVDNE